MPEFLRNERLRSVILIAFLMQGYDLSVGGFVARHLLSAYDTTVLPYFNFFSASLICVVVLMTSFMIKRIGFTFSRYVVVAHLLLIPALYLLTWTPYRWSIFVTCTIFTGTCISFYIAFVSNSARFLNIRESRFFGGYIVAVTGLSSLCFSGVIWVLVKLFSSSALLILAGVCCLMMLFLSRNIHDKDQGIVQQKNTASLALPKYYFPFLIYALALRIAVAVIVAYLFLVYLKTNYSGETLAIMSAMYAAVFSLAVVIFQLLFQERFFNWFGISGVILLFPAFIVVVSTASLFLSAIPIIVLLIFITSVVSLPLVAAKETLMSTATRSVQLRLRTQIIFIETIVGEAIIGSLILLFFGEGPDATRNLTLAIIILCGISLLVAWFISRGFKEVLRGQVEQPRYLFYQTNVGQGGLGPITSDVAADAKRIALKVLKRGVREPMRGGVLLVLDAESRRAVKYLRAFQVEPREHVKLELKAQHAKSLERFLYLFAALNTDTRGVLNSIPKIQDQMFAKWDDLERAKAIEYLDAISDNAVLRRKLKETLEVREAATNIPLPEDDWIQRIAKIEVFEPKANMTIDEKMLFLRRVSLFGAIAAEGLDTIAVKLREHTVKPGEVIFHQGDEANSLFMVVTGEVEIWVDQKKQADIHPFGLFGELAFLDARPRSATAIAKTDVVLLTLERAEFQRLLEEVPEFVKAIIHQLMVYLRKSERYGT